MSSPPNTTCCPSAKQHERGLVTDVLVIGAGPAGLAAARAARQRGASVTLFDSSDQLGGQFWRHLPDTRPSAAEQSLHHGWDTFRSLSQTLESDSRCRIIRSAQVWAIETSPGGPGTVHVMVGQSDGVGREKLAEKARNELLPEESRRHAHRPHGDQNCAHGNHRGTV